MNEIIVFVVLMILWRLVFSRFRVSWRMFLKNTAILFIFKPDQIRNISLFILVIGLIFSIRQMLIYDVELIEMVLRLGVMSSLVLSIALESKIFLYALVILSVPWIVYFFKYKKTAENLAFCVENSAEISKKGCEWSSKPIVVKGNFKRRTVIGSGGVLVITRKGKMIVLVKRSAHERLGRPCLEEFAVNLSRCLYPDGGEST